jgi:hypothetical protein
MIQVTLMEGVDSLADLDPLGHPDPDKVKATTFLATGIGHSPDGFVTFVTKDGILRVGTWGTFDDHWIFSFEGSFYRFIQENAL